MHDESVPAVVDGQAGDDVADERSVDRAATVDDQHRAVSRLRQQLPNEGVVLVDADGPYATDTSGAAPIRTELHVARAGPVPELVDEIGGAEGTPSEFIRPVPGPPSNGYDRLLSASSRSTTASVNSAVLASPRRSRVRIPPVSAASTAASMESPQP